MRSAKLILLVGLWVSLLIPTVALAQEEEQDQPALDQTVHLVRFEHEGRTILGKLVSENAATVVMRKLDGERATFARSAITDMEELELSSSQYLELQADRLYDRIDTDDYEQAAEQLLHIRRLYRRALVGAEQPKRRERLETKLEVTEEDRDVLQEDSIKKEKLRRERLETELVQAEKRLAEKRLEGIEEQQAAINRLQQVAENLARRDQQLAEVAEKLGEALEEVNADLRDLAEDVDDLEDRSRHFINRTVVVDLSKNYRDLEEEVDRLKRALRQLQNDEE